jgi:hypothetical protein
MQTGVIEVAGLKSHWSVAVDATASSMVSNCLQWKKKY